MSSQGEFQELVQNAMDNATESKSLEGRRYAYWDQSTDTVVITDPSNPDGGTAFKPTNGYAYYKGLQ